LASTAPELLSLFGVGPDTAAGLLISAGDNPERLHSEAAWAHLCGAAPIPASSGKSAGRYRLDRGGDRQANAALWRIVMVRIAHDPTTTTYFERKVKEGRSKRDIIRLLKRYLAREVYDICLAAEPEAVGLAQPQTVAHFGLTFRRLVDPRSGTTSLPTRVIRACPHTE
jgi:transposase